MAKSFNLTSNHVLWSGRPLSYSFIFNYFYPFCIGLLGVVLGHLVPYAAAKFYSTIAYIMAGIVFVGLLLEHLRTLTQNYMVTTEYIRQVNILGFSERDIQIWNVKDISIYRNFGQILLGTGTLRVHTDNGIGITLLDIQNPEKVRILLLDLIKEYRRSS
jgi:hypothetical protein